MRLKSLACMTCLVASLYAPAQDNNGLDLLKKHFANIAAYNNNITQEKVYLHLDNNSYFPGDKIWFKAYVVQAGNLLPTALSKVLYVELLSAEGEVVERKTCEIINGRTFGEIDLNNITGTGFYEVRAYTRAMTNWDGALAFSRVVPIYNKPKNAASLKGLTLARPIYDQKAAFKRTQPNMQWATEKAQEKSQKRMVAFYPEGGNIVAGQATRVAYKLTDEYGMPANDSFNIYKADGTLYFSTTPVHDGMGMFTIPADYSGGYAEVGNGKKNQRAPLPEAATKAVVLETSLLPNGDLHIRLAGGPDVQGLLGISFTTRGIATRFDTLNARPGFVYEKDVKREHLRDGITQITVFTPQGEILAERLTWVKPLTQPTQLEVKQNATSYKAFSPIVLDFTLKDGEGNPIQGEFSLSVQDADAVIAPDANDIALDMLLCSDLRGYIHKPRYYFEADDDAHQQALDLLLMVQGWRRYSWKEMSGVTPFVLKQPAEDRQIIDGRVVGWSKKTNTDGLDINLMLVRERSFISGSTKSEPDGRFALALNEPLYGDCYGLFVVNNAREKHSSVNIGLNRKFDIAPREYSPYELVLEKVETVRSENKKKEGTPETFTWVDTLPKIRILPEAEISRKAIVKPRLGTIYTYLGGEEAGKRAASLYYNLEDALQEIYDEGSDDMNIFEWLAKVNPYFDYKPGYKIGDILYKGRKVRFLFNNAQPMAEDERPSLPSEEENKELVPNADKMPFDDTRYHGLLSEFTSMVIIDKSSTANNFANMPLDMVDADASPNPLLEAENPFNDSPDKGDTPVGRDITKVGNNTVLMILYANPSPSIISENKKGQRATIIHGFSVPSEFYCPNYREQTAPDDSDYRRTLYWNPIMLTDKQGHADVILYGNARTEQRLHINAQGISAKGQFFSISHKK